MKAKKKKKRSESLHIVYTNNLIVTVFTYKKINQIKSILFSLSPLSHTNTPKQKSNINKVQYIIRFLHFFALNVKQYYPFLFSLGNIHLTVD